MQEALFASERTKKTALGHERILAFIEHAASADRLAHAYLFAGPEHVGKMAAALAVAASLLGTGAPASHPDFTLIERGRDPKTGKLHGWIVIDQAHALVGRLSLGAFMGGWKVCVIDGAHLLNTEAANALLKTLEEPRPKTVLILLAISESDVLPTIRSRCQVMRFDRVPSATIVGHLIAAGTAPDKALLYARLSGGLPGKAIAFAEDPAAIESLFALRDTFLGFPGVSIAERWAAIGKLIPAKLPFQEAGDRAASALDLAAELIRDALVASAGRPDAAAHIDVRDRIAVWAAAVGPRRLAAAAEQIEATRRLIEANVSPRAALERFVLSF